jgi:hypothetical protein
VTSETPSIAAGMESKGAPGAPTLSQPVSSKKMAQKGRSGRMTSHETIKVNELQIFA